MLDYIRLLFFFSQNFFPFFIHFFPSIHKNKTGVDVHQHIGAKKLQIMGNYQSVMLLNASMDRSFAGKWFKFILSILRMLEIKCEKRKEKI